MARSIGAVKIKRIKELIQCEAGKFQPLALNSYQLQEHVKSLIPESYFDIWESAWSEIDRVISDEISRIKYTKN